MRPVVIGLMLGAGAGLSVGWLCAPVSGKRARSLVKENANKVRRVAVDFVAERKEHFDVARQKFNFAPRHIDDSLDEATMEALAGR